MTTEDKLRLLLAIEMLLVLPWAFRARLRSRTDEKLDRWQEGAIILFGLRISALPAFLGVLTWMLKPNWMSWSSLPVPVPIRILGLLIFACGGSLLLWTFHNLGQNLTDTVVTRRDHVLITSGPYRFVRHPFYLSSVFVLVGISLVMSNWFIPIAGLIPLLFIIARTPIEERKLMEKFGPEYAAYQQRVPRFVPRWPAK